ncbi:MAG: hypothetical protein RIQ65_279, partial [Pseudomonadota bacterium]
MVKFKVRKFNSCKKDLYEKLIGSFIKNGLKLKIKKQVHKAFQILRVTTGYSFSYILIALLAELNTFIEVREVYLRKKKTFVPFFISFERRFFLALSWLIKSLKDNKNKLSFAEKLVIEISAILKVNGHKTSKALNYK